MVYEDLNINEFESFIYKESSEQYFNADDYLTLISINYKSKLARYESLKVLKKNIDFGRLEVFRVLDILECALKNDKNLGVYLIDIYDLYFYGYNFLGRIAIDYGLTCTFTPEGFSGESWYEVSDKEKEQLHNMVLPDLNKHLIKAINWINDGKIKITGEKDRLDRWVYVDSRTPDDKDNTYEN